MPPPKRPPYDPVAAGCLCAHCPLRGKPVVPPKGPPDADFMIVGEAPGFHEELRGEPFIGASGVELDSIFHELGKRGYNVSRKRTWLTNTILCRNETPGVTGAKKYDLPTYLAWIRKQNAERKRAAMEQAKAEGWKKGDPPPQWVPIASPIDCCLRGDTTVLMADGSWRSIKSIVDEKCVAPVMSVDAFGALVAAPIVNWYANDRRDRKLVRVATRHLGHGWGSVVTDDHTFLTPRGWIAAKDLASGIDQIATGEPMPTGAAWSIFVGSLLGDGSISSNGYLSVAHTEEHEDYVRLKALALSDLGVRLDHRQCASTVRPGSRPQWRLATRVLRWIKQLRPFFYGTGGRTIPDWITLDPLSIATWFMDDGSMSFRQGEGRRPCAQFATNRLSRDGVEKLRVALSAVGITTTIKYGSGWRIGVGVDATPILSEMIAPFVPESMQYKLLPEHRGKFDASAFRPTSTTAYDVVSVEPAPLKHSWSPGYPKTVYCIDVFGTHNFITRAGVVHNCAPRLWTEIAHFERVARERGEPNGIAIVPTGNYAAEAVVGRLGIMKLRGSPFEIDIKDPRAHLHRDPWEGHE